MLGNVVQSFLFKVTVPTQIGPITPNAYTDMTYTYPGAGVKTCVIVGGMLSCDPDQAFDIGQACQVSAWVSAANTIKVRFYNLTPNTTNLNILAGAVFYGYIAKCDDNFALDGI